MAGCSWFWPKNQRQGISDNELFGEQWKDAEHDGLDPVAILVTATQSIEFGISHGGREQF
jgi:hypothetical protein